MRLIKNADAIEPYELIHPLLHKDKTLIETLNNSKEKALEPLVRKIPYMENSPLSYENLIETKEMSWLKKTKLNLVKPRKKQNRYILDTLIDTLKDKAKIVPEFVSDCGLPMLAIDTETTSLNTFFLLEGGSLRKYLSLVGVPIAVSHKEGYYLPVNHNETDGVSNFTEEEIVYFLQRLSNEFFLIYFNFKYDGAVLMTNGVELNPRTYADVMLVGDAKGLDTNDDLYQGRGLKNLSDFYLNRKMLEIKEILGIKGSEHIQFSSISAKDATTYAIPDALNTYGLFRKFVLKERYEERNPYRYNGDILYLDHQVLYHHIGMFSHGTPLNNYENLEENLKTIIYRQDKMEEAYRDIDGSENYPIGTPQKVNMFIAELVFNAMLKKHDLILSQEIIENVKHPKRTQIDNAIGMISEHFGIILTIKENKSRGTFLEATTRKIGYGSRAKGVEVLNLTKESIYEKEYWQKVLKRRVLNQLKTVVNVVDMYRTLQLEVGRLGKMYRYAIGDDRGHPVVFADLRFNGTDTRRYKNAGGKGHSRFIVSGAKLSLVSFFDGDGSAGINAQGLPSTPYQRFTPDKGKRNPVRIKSIKNKAYNNWIKVTRRKLHEKLKLLLITKLNQKK
jgi:hypothetical protein